MTELSPIPNSKKRLVISIIFGLIGLILAITNTAFEFQNEIGWGMVILGIIGVIYNIMCMKKTTKE